MAKKQDKFDKSDDIQMTIKKHKVSVTNSIFVNINHKKTCIKPCPFSDLIVEYLKDEMFVEGKYIVTNTYDK